MRDFLAAAALTGLATTFARPGTNAEEAGRLAGAAYRLADAMLAARGPTVPLPPAVTLDGLDDAA